MYVIKQAVRGVTIQTHIVDPNDRVWLLRREPCDALSSAGYKDLHMKKQHLAITHLLKRLKPLLLYRIMTDIISWKEDKNFRKETF